MPREPRCDKDGLNATKGDDAVPGDGTARSPEAAVAHSCRNPKGRGILCRMPALLGLDDRSLRVVVALPPWPATESAASRPRVILLGALEIAPRLCGGNTARARGRTGQWSKLGGRDRRCARCVLPETPKAAAGQTRRPGEKTRVRRAEKL